MPQGEKPKVIVIVGPTGSGKTALSIELAKEFNGEVISADSRQVYQGLDLGTGKVTETEMQGIPHHLIDVADPKERFTVADFKKQAEQSLRYIVRNGKLPIIAGGTAFYIQALVDGIMPPEVPPNKALREKLEEKSTAALYKELQEKDPDRAETIEKENKRRLIRALEIVDTLGKVPRQKPTHPYNPLFIGINVPDRLLRERIEKRIVERIDAGMFDEFRKLHENGLSFERMEELGLEYRYGAYFLQGNITEQEFVEQLTTKTWQYAKQQLTWLKRDERIEWFTVNENGLDVEKIKTRV